MPTLPNNVVTLGSIGRPYALKGWVRLRSFTDPPDHILTYPNLLIQQRALWVPLALSGTEVRATNIVIKIAGCDTPEQAQHYTNCQVGVERDRLPELEEDEHYWADLEGLTVINQKGITLGQVDYLFETGANDVIVVKGDRERLLPYIESTVLKVDLEKKEMWVDWDEDF